MFRIIYSGDIRLRRGKVSVYDLFFLLIQSVEDHTADVIVIN